MNKMMYFAALAVVGTMFASCGEKDYYNPEEMEAITKAEYAANFEKNYGKVNPEQTWDFTSGPEYYLNAMGTKATRAEGDPTITTGEYYEVENETLKWLTNKLKESTDNRSLGKPFAMTAPNNTFTIVPIYQGQAGMSWDLHMVVGSGENAKDMKLWSKSQGIQTYKKVYWSSTKTWVDLGSGDNTIGAEKVRSRQYTIGNIPVGETIYFYLEITSGLSDWATKGTKQSSLSGMMLALDCPRPSNIDKDNEVMVIGCEDANLTSDWDLNDVVFLVYGKPEVPKPIEITDNKVVEKQEKRYMIEDLGSTDDFDFNDIVVDVKGERTVTYTLVNGVIDYSKTQYGEWTQQASIVHLGGTLGFQLTIGNTKLEPMGGRMMGDDEELTDATFEVSGWDPSQNNISIAVNEKKNQGVYTVAFPKKGEVPMIIAFPTKQKWMPERESIPSEWFTE